MDKTGRKKRIIELASNAGYCYGVERAIKKAEGALKKKGKVYCLGPVIHNPKVVEALVNKGLVLIESISELPEGSTIIIRSHGVSPEILREMKEKKAKIIDATCPFVRRAQMVALQLFKKKYEVVVVGEKIHPEVLGIIGYAGQGARVISSKKEAIKLPYSKKRGVVFQTTQSDSIIDEVTAEIVRKSNEVLFHNTVCEATRERQRSAKELAGKTDIVIVIGGRNSGNTKRLYEICHEINPRTYLVENAEEIRPEWFFHSDRIGVTAGASTPRSHIEKAIRRLENIG